MKDATYTRQQGTAQAFQTRGSHLSMAVLQRQCACGQHAITGVECTDCQKKRLQRRPISQTEAMEIPPIVPEVLRSPGQPLDPAARAFMEPRFGHDFSQVRVHTDALAAKSALAVNALAYTVGRDMVFGEGQYAPERTAGKRLLAHELTHVVQQGQGLQQSLAMSRPEDKAERDADIIAERVVLGGHAQTVGTASASSLLQRQQAGPGTAPTAAPRMPGPTSVFAGEDPTLRSRRFSVIDAARNGILRLTGALSGGYLWPFETSSANRVDIRHPSYIPVQETVAGRGARLRRMVGDLIQLVSMLEGAPITPTWLGNTARFPGGTMNIGGFAQPWQDTAMFYAHLTGALGRDMNEISLDLFYLDTDPIPTKRIERALVLQGVGLGIYIVVPDPDNAPLSSIRRLTPYEGWNMRGVIMEVWHDDFGYYYPYKGKKHYLPGRP